jgi:hypothetical protein
MAKKIQIDPARCGPTGCAAENVTVELSGTNKVVDRQCQVKWS